MGVSTESAGAGSFGGTFSAEPTIRYSSAASRPRCALWSDASSVAKRNTETGVDCGRGSGGPSKFHVLYLLRPAMAEFLWDHDEDRLSIRAREIDSAIFRSPIGRTPSRSEGRPCVSTSLGVRRCDVVGKQEIEAVGDRQHPGSRPRYVGYAVLPDD